MSRFTEPAAALARCLALVAILFSAHLCAADAARYGIGQPVSAREIAGWDIDVRPDGQGLPRGRGSVAQGQGVYDAKCAQCHGTFGESNDYIAIAGGVGSLGSDQPVRTIGSKLNYATTLWDYINRAMPFDHPKSLSADEVYALTAYVLNLNDILPPDATLDQASLLKVVMPNRNGFTTAHGFMRKDGKPDVANAACMRDCPVEAKIASQIPDYAHDLHGDVALQSQRMAAAPASAPAARELAQRSGCTACHGVDTRIVGPGFRQVAARYGQDPAAEAKLVAKLKSGGAGSWGKTPMPSQGHLPDADLHRLAQWVLSGAN